MSVVDLECIKSEYSMEGDCFDLPEEQLLRLGQCYGACFATGLFFHLPPLERSQHIKQARLFLFKIPEETCCDCFEHMENQYAAYPLLEFFGESSSFENLQFDKELYVEFWDKFCACNTEIDIT